MDLIEIANEDSTGWDTLADVVRVSLPFLRVEVSVQMGDPFAGQRPSTTYFVKGENIGLTEDPQTL